MMRALLKRPRTVPSSPEPDTTPVMNLFMILIPFLIGVAAFSQLAVVDLAVSEPSPNEPEPTPEAPPLVVALDTHELLVGLGNEILGRGLTSTGLPPLASASLDPRPVPDGLVSLLSRLLKTARSRFPHLRRVIVAATPEVRCGDVVTGLDLCRAYGFVDVGLAGAQVWEGSR